MDCVQTHTNKRKQNLSAFGKWHAIPVTSTQRGGNTCCLNCFAAFSIRWNPSSRLLLASSSFFWTRLWFIHLDTKMAVAEPQSTAVTKRLSTSTSGHSPFTFSRAMFLQLSTRGSCSSPEYLRAKQQREEGMGRAGDL